MTHWIILGVVVLISLGALYVQIKYPDPFDWDHFTYI